MTATAKDRDYYFLFAEFGSYSAIRILGALRRENQAHYFTPEGSASRKHSKAELLECFCPASPSWRNSVVSQSIEIIQRAEDAAFEIASTKR
jgi:hypothetical protein